MRARSQSSFVLIDGANVAETKMRRIILYSLSPSPIIENINHQHYHPEQVMAEQTLSELVMNLISWIESLHEKNLKYEAQVETLSRDLAKAQNSNEELEARLSAYQNGTDSKPTVITTTQVPQLAEHLCNHHNNQIDSTRIHPTQNHQQQTIYQPMHNSQPFVPHQPAQYVWTTYDASGQVSYYEQYGNAAAPTFQQQ